MQAARCGRVQASVSALAVGDKVGAGEDGIIIFIVLCVYGLCGN